MFSRCTEENTQPEKLNTLNSSTQTGCNPVGFVRIILRGYCKFIFQRKTIASKCQQR
jgi:hypothetical protein